MAVLAAGLPAAHAFVLGGPINEAWQVRDLGYALPYDLVAPKNIGEDYRRNTPVIYYAFDETFLDFFGSNGVWAVDQAFAILNNLTNASSYSADLSEIPLEARRFNQTAGALNLIVYMMGFVFLFDRMHYRHKMRLPSLITLEELDRIQAIWSACQDT